MTEFELYNRIVRGDLRPNLEQFSSNKGINKLEEEFFSESIMIDENFPDSLSDGFNFDFHGVKEGDKIEIEIKEESNPPKLIIRSVPNPNEEELFNLDIPPPPDKKAEIFLRIVECEFNRIKSVFRRKLVSIEDLNELKVFVTKNIQHAKDIAKEAHIFEKKLKNPDIDNLDNSNTYILYIIKIHLIYCITDIQELFGPICDIDIQTYHELEDELYDYQYSKMLTKVTTFADWMNKKHLERIYNELGSDTELEEKINKFRELLLDQEKKIDEELKKKSNITKHDFDKRELYEIELGKLLSQYYFETLIEAPKSIGIHEKYKEVIKIVSNLKFKSDSIDTKALKKAGFFEKIDIEISILKELINVNNSLSISDSLLKDIVSSLLIIQTRKQLKLDENEWNDYLTDLLRVRKHYVTDQSRSGLSANSANNNFGVGELDIIIRDKDNYGTVISIIESMMLSSCGKNNKSIKNHIAKLISRYDPNGNRENFLVVFATAFSFSKLWEKYLTYVDNIGTRNEYRIKVLDYEEIQKSDLHIGVSTILRETIEIKLYHLFLNMNTN